MIEKENNTLIKQNNEIDDDEVVIRLLDKDAYGIELLFTNYFNYIKNFIKKKFKSLTAEDCEELALDSIMKIENNIQKYDSKKSKFSSWIIQIANNTTIDKFRKKRLKSIALDIKKAENIKFETNKNIIKNNNPLIDICIEALNSLSSIEQDMIRTDIHLDDQEETNTIFEKELNMARSTVRVKKKRAYDKIRKYIENKGYQLTELEGA